MIQQATIMEHFQIPMLISDVKEQGTKQEQSFLSWVRDDIKFASNHAHAAYIFYQQILTEGLVPENPKIVEYFAGAGIHAVLAEELLQPSKHVCLDRNPLAAQQLKLVSQRYPRMWTFQSSFEDWSERHRDDLFDIHDLDNPCFTAAQIRHYHMELSHIFNSRPAVIKLTDVAGTKMCWNRKYFAKHFKKDFYSYEEYLILMSFRFYDLFGYSIDFGYVYDGVAMVCFREGQHQANILKLSNEPKGLVLSENGLQESQRNS